MQLNQVSTLGGGFDNASMSSRSSASEPSSLEDFSDDDSEDSFEPRQPTPPRRFTFDFVNNGNYNNNQLLAPSFSAVSS